MSKKEKRRVFGITLDTTFRRKTSRIRNIPFGWGIFVSGKVKNASNCY
ncbi:MAG: hypothetical protein WA584_23180 [Pyrinomonadaceae bacterium]